MTLARSASLKRPLESRAKLKVDQYNWGVHHRWPHVPTERPLLYIRTWNQMCVGGVSEILFGDLNGAVRYRFDSTSEMY
jgi:hypothetical protein